MTRHLSLLLTPSPDRIGLLSETDLTQNIGIEGQTNKCLNYPPHLKEKGEGFSLNSTVDFDTALKNRAIVMEAENKSCPTLTLHLFPNKRNAEQSFTVLYFADDNLGQIVELYLRKYERISRHVMNTFHFIKTITAIMLF